MSSFLSELVERYRFDEVARSVKDLRLAGQSLRETHVLLETRGFVLRAEAIAGECAPDGARQWVRRDGSATVNRADAELVPVDCYVHHDGGMVRVFPLGDPRGRLVPAGKPAAIKSVLFESAEHAAEADTSFRNEAFRVTNDGDPVPKSSRTSYGLRQDPLSAARSYELARGVLAQIVLPLRLDTR
jgi:hypothetical protein